MIVSWLFEIDTYRYSTKNTTFLGTEYFAKIIPDSFDGIVMRGDVEHQGLITPSDLSFKIDNADGTLSKNDFNGEYCTIILGTDGSLCRKWKFKIETVSEYYGTLTLYCVDILQKSLLGSFPNTPHPRELFPSENHEVSEDDDYRMPVIFGKAYIPLMYVYRTATNTGYYFLGADTSYDILKVKSPPSKGKTVWESTDYTFSQYTATSPTNYKDYKIAEFRIAPTSNHGVYAPGTWASDLKPLVQYRYTGDGDSLNPAYILYAVLRSFGVHENNISYPSFESAATTFAAQGITWKGAFYKSTPRETLVNNLLSQCDANFYISDQIELRPFEKESKETFTTAKIKKLSFSSSKITRPDIDSGRVHWVKTDSPQHELVGKAIVPLVPYGIVDTPDDSVFQATFIDDSVVAQKLGILYFQRKTAIESISFMTAGPNMSTLSTLVPGNVVTVNDPIFGNSFNIIVTNIDIKPDLEVGISGVHLTYLNEFSDITASEVVIPDNEELPTLSENTGLLFNISFGIVGTSLGQSNDFSGYYAGGLNAEDYMVNAPILRDIDFPPYFVDSIMYATFVNAATVYLVMQKDYSTVACFKFVAGTNIASLHDPDNLLGTGISFDAGDTIQILCTTTDPY